MAEKIIRDPVHDVIAFRLDRPADALLFRLINAAEFQRLRRIRQLFGIDRARAAAQFHVSHMVENLRGIRDAGVTSLSAELGRPVTVDDLLPVVERHLPTLL